MTSWEALLLQTATTEPNYGKFIFFFSFNKWKTNNDFIHDGIDLTCSIAQLLQLHEHNSSINYFLFLLFVVLVLNLIWIKLHSEKIIILHYDLQDGVLRNDGIEQISHSHWVNFTSSVTNANNIMCINHIIDAHRIPYVYICIFEITIFRCKGRGSRRVRWYVFRLRTAKKRNRYTKGKYIRLSNFGLVLN